MKKPKMTHEEHLVLGPQLVKLKQDLGDMAMMLQEKFGKSHDAMHHIMHARSCIVAACDELDREHHAIMSDEVFLKVGHVYYAGTSPSAPQARSKDLGCHWSSWRVVAPGRLELQLPAGNYVDMNGCIQTAVALMPEVTRVDTRCADCADTTYVKHGEVWEPAS